MSGVEFPIRVVVRARELREAEWPLERIADIIGRETGKRPHPATVSRWCNPDSSQRHRDYSRARMRHQRIGNGNGGRLGAGHHSTDFQEFRARTMVEAGIRSTQVALVMDFDYPGQGWTFQRLRYLVESEAVAA